MESALLAIAAAALIAVALLYWRGIRQRNHLTNLLLLVLLDQSIYETQRVGFEKFLASSAASDATQLGARSHVAAGHLADSLAETMIATSGMLWRRRQELQNS